MLLNCCIVWSLPKIFFSGLPTDNYSKRRKKRIIPVTNIADLAEYVFLPHNNDVTKPRALNTFLDELAELGFDKGLIKNKNLLSDLIEKEKGYQNAEDTSDDESNNEESSSDIENQEEEEVASENGVELKAPKRATTTLKTIVRKQKVVALKRPPPFTLKIFGNIARTLMCTGH